MKRGGVQLAAMALLLGGTCHAMPESASVVAVKSGKGFVARADSLFGDSSRPVRVTNWVDLNFHPFVDDYRLRPFGMQLGLQQSEDATRNTACRIAPSIAGKKYCSKVTTEAGEASYFTAFYGGVQTDIVELASRDRRPWKVMIGAGAAAIRHYAVEGSLLLPYSSLEVGYQLRERLHARAGAFVSYLAELGGMGISAPSISLEYRF